MKADETKSFFLTLLGRADITGDQPTLSLANISAKRMWAAFKLTMQSGLDAAPILKVGIGPDAFPFYQCGAAQRQAVSWQMPSNHVEKKHS